MDMPQNDQPDRRQLRQQQQQQQQARERKRRLLRRGGLWGGALALIVLVGWGVLRLADTVELPVTGGALAVPVSAADHGLGPQDAPLTLVEYSDFQCPACGAFYPVIKQMMAEPTLKDRIRFVYRNFPLTQIHQNAQLAAQAGEAAALQGKFWEMHDRLFEQQAKWSDMSSAGARDTFVGYARDLGLNVDRFTADLDSAAVQDRVQVDVDSGTRSAVSGTPTFFVNGIVIPSPQSYDQFKQYLIDAAQPRS